MATPVLREISSTNYFKSWLSFHTEIGLVIMPLVGKATGGIMVAKIYETACVRIRVVS